MNALKERVEVANDELLQYQALLGDDVIEEAVRRICTRARMHTQQSIS